MLPVRRTIATLVSAVVVALTWPLSLPAWWTQISVSLQRKQLLSPRLATVTDFFTVTLQDARVAVEENGTAQLHSKGGLAHKRTSSFAVEADTALVTCAPFVGGTDVWSKTHKGLRCFVLAAVLLGGGLFGQLDWQVPYQVWPYPSLIAYTTVRAAFGLIDLKANLFFS
jgi:hypothetical protein